VADTPPTVSAPLAEAATARPAPDLATTPQADDTALPDIDTLPDEPLPNPAGSVAMAQQMLEALEPLASSSASDAASADVATTLRMGDLALADGKADAAAAHFRLALEEDPNHADALAGLAMSLLMAGRHTEAVAVYRKLLDVRPDDRTAWHNLALALVRTGELFEAEHLYLRLLDREPDFIEARANLATLHQARGKLADAAKQWRAVIAQDPERANAWANLGEVLVDLGEAEQAMLAYAEAAKLEPKLASAWLNYAVAAQEAGSGGRAMAALERAIKLAPYDPEPWRMLGDVKLQLYRATEDKALLTGAIAAWRKSLELDRHQPQLKERLDLYEPLTDEANP
jgi:tetratricopeptide (TPR) repeat protein